METITLKTIPKRTSQAFGKKVYLLGKTKDGDYLWLEEARFDCGWYWAFGYIESYTNNKYPNLAKDINCHTHWDSRIIGQYEYYDHDKECFRLSSNYVHTFNDNPNIEETVLNESENWKLAELMSAFYKLKTTAEVLGKGGSNITANPCAALIKNKAEVKRINEIVLPALFQEVYKILEPIN